MIYLDAAATTPVRREALEAMWPYLTGDFGNPSSHHDVGESAARALADARARLARAFGASAGGVTFTSGGTEADNLALKGIALAAPRGRRLITTPIEHHAVLESADYLARHHGFEIELVPVDAHGRVDPADLAAMLRPDTSLVSVQYANNEVGTVQPIAELAAIARAARVPFHTDAVQAAGALPVHLADLGVDALSLSGHKVGAPKGVGALLTRPGLRIEPVLHGGGQERGRRSGTENVAGAMAFAVAAELAEAERPETSPRLTRLRDELVATVLRIASGAILTGHPGERLPGNASFCFPGTSGESVLLALAERGVWCSSGSACAAGEDDPSHVLLALGVEPSQAQTAVRFSLPATTTSDDVTAAASALAAALDRLRRAS